MSQVEWAEQIRPRVNAEFDRVARALSSAASVRGNLVKAETHIVLDILEEKRAEVMARTQAGYFIRHWQELGDQVRVMIGADPRFQALRANRPASQHSVQQETKL